MDRRRERWIDGTDRETSRDSQTDGWTDKHKVKVKSDCRNLTFFFWTDKKQLKVDVLRQERH